MKTKLLSLLFAIVANIGTIFAERILVDDLYFDLNTSTRTAMVTYQQEISQTNYSGLTIATIPESVEYNSINYNVTSIADRAFCFCKSLTNVTIPSSITSIGVQAFMNCTGLTSVTLPINIKIIKESAFNGCTGLTSIEIPENVTNIEVSAFSCSNLTNVVLNSNAVLSKTYTTSFNLKSFFGAQVTEYVIGNNVTSIGDCAFYECSGITSIEIPNNITRIGNGSFYGCSSLTSVTIPNSVTSIGGCAFQACSGLTSVEIPNTVTSIESYAFESCTGLVSVKIPSSVASIGYYAFYGCSSLTSVTIPNSVTSIGNNVFYGCSNLTSVYCESATPASIQSNTFPSSAIFYVPNCAYTVFHNAPTWKDFNIVPVDVNLAVMNNTGGVVVENCGQMEIEAIPYIGYHFKRWQDGNKDNPRKYTLSQSNRNFIAEFEIDKYQITLSCDANQGSVTGDQGKFNFDTEHEIEAVPNYGYHFTQWSDGETENPRTFVLEQDTTFTALFAPNKYSLAIQYNDTYGEVEGEEGEFDYLSEHTITVNAKYGYHLDAWSDGVTDNPRTLVLTKDTTVTAIFAPNKYALELIADANLGEIEGEQGAFDYLSEHEIQAVPKTGCVFNGWSDGVTANPRTIILTKDTSITALFEQYVHEVTVLCNDEQGAVAKSGETYHSAECTITATPNYGYHFVQWNDGVTENPRTFVVTQDTTFTAEFAVDRTGSCGTDLALTWTYDPEEKVLTISGAGAFNDNMQCGVEARTALTKVEFAEGVTSVGASAFANCETLQTLVLGKDVKKINENAFYNCENLTTIYNYRPTPANALSTAFDGVDKFECILYVPQSALDLYKNASVWRDFYYTQALPETPTGVKDTQSDQVQCTKVVRDGQILILRGDKTYTLTGQAVK